MGEAGRGAGEAASVGLSWVVLLVSLTRPTPHVAPRDCPLSMCFVTLQMCSPSLCPARQLNSPGSEAETSRPGRRLRPGSGSLSLLPPPLVETGQKADGEVDSPSRKEGRRKLAVGPSPAPGRGGGVRARSDDVTSVNILPFFPSKLILRHQT